MAQKIIVTSALPYANGPIHFGHVVGAYLPADIFVRYQRMCGNDVHYVCGADEHGVAITLKAEQAGVSYEEYVDRWQKEILATLQRVGIEFDIFTGTAHHRNPYHRSLAQQFFTDLQENGLLLEKTEEQFYSETLERFLPDRYVQGTCYECGHQQARGDECPKCGTWIDARRLLDPKCTVDGSTPVFRESRHWYLDLGRIRDEWLQQWFESKMDDWKPNVARFVASALKDLRERPITRDLPWGVPLPMAGTEGKVLYVWFEAPIGYLSISRQFFQQEGRPEDFDKWWRDPQTKLYHFIGKDNITFHTVVFPAMLHGTKKGWIVPENVPANEFFNLEGRKFNTSAGWFIPEASIEGKYPVDAVRYALTTMMPETADSDWSWREFQSRVNDDLADNLGNFVARTLRFAERFMDGVIPPPGRVTADDEALLDEGRRAARDMAAAFDAFQFRKACQRLLAYGSACNRYYDQQTPWLTRKKDPKKCGHTLRICAEAIRTLAVLCSPILPETARTLRRALGIPGDPLLEEAGGMSRPKGPLRAGALAVLFPKVPDKEVDAQLAALESMGVAGTEPELEQRHEPLADQIQFDSFAAADLRAGTVLQAEKHPKADRLLVLKVDLGFEVRTIVAGVAGSYSPKELIGLQVIAVANLEPRKLRGVFSQGMLLATDDAEGHPRFLAPAPGTPNGVRVR